MFLPGLCSSLAPQWSWLSDPCTGEGWAASSCCANAPGEPPSSCCSASASSTTHQETDHVGTHRAAHAVFVNGTKTLYVYEFVLYRGNDQNQLACLIIDPRITCTVLSTIIASTEKRLYLCLSTWKVRPTALAVILYNITLWKLLWDNISFISNQWFQ